MDEGPMMQNKKEVKIEITQVQQVHNEMRQRIKVSEYIVER